MDRPPVESGSIGSESRGLQWIRSGRRSPLRPGALGILVVFSVGAFVADGTKGASVEEWLVRLDRAAQRHVATARSFACEESIRWTRKGDSGRERFGYVVVLDEHGTFDDYRTRLRRGSKKSPVKRVRPEDHKVPAYLGSAISWSFIFRRDRWPAHRYEIDGEDEVLGRPAVVIRFEPIPPFRESVNNWYGSAWVDRDTAELLKVVAHRPEDHAELQRIERHRVGEAVSSWAYLVEEVTTEFDIEREGLRFPSRVELQHVQYDFLRGLRDWKRQETRVLEVYQTYSGYRFFEVQSETVLGESN